MKRTKYQLIKIRINSAGETVKFAADSDKLYQRVEGIFVSLPAEDSHFGSSIELRIAEQEIFPEGFETKLLAANQSTNPGNRFMLFDNDEVVEAAGSKIEGRLTDGGYTNGITFPYMAIIYLKLKNDIPENEQQSK